MSVTAEKLGKSGARGEDLNAIVREQIQMIDARLQGAPRMWGRNVVTIDLPRHFSIPGLSPNDTQRIVYSALLRSLDDRGFETRVLLEDSAGQPASRLFIAWMTDLDKKEVMAMNAVLKSHVITEAAVPEFIQVGFADSSRTASAVRAGRAEPGAPMRVHEDKEMKPRGGLEARPTTAAADAAAATTPAAPSRAEREILGSS